MSPIGCSYGAPVPETGPETIARWTPDTVLAVLSSDVENLQCW